MRTLSLTVQGMSCGHCLNAVNAALASLPGVAIKAVRIGKAEVEYDPAVTDAAKIAAAVEGAGYDVVGSTE